MSKKRATDVIKLVGLFPFVVLVLGVLLPCLAIYIVFDYCRGCWLRRRFRKRWGSEGKFILFVYSESLNLEDHIKKIIFPKLSHCAVLLNYSRRNEWKSKKPLEAKIWEQWGSDMEFNTMAIVLPERGKIKTVRSYQAFRDFKHGKDGLLRQKEAELFSLVSQIKPTVNLPEN